MSTGRKTRGKLGSLRIDTITVIPDDEPLVVEVRRCADALEKIAAAFEPEPVPDHAAFTVGTPRDE